MLFSIFFLVEIDYTPFYFIVMQSNRASQVPQCGRIDLTDRFLLPIVINFFNPKIESVNFDTRTLRACVVI